MILNFNLLTHELVQSGTSRPAMMCTVMYCKQLSYEKCMRVLWLSADSGDIPESTCSYMHYYKRHLPTELWYTVLYIQYIITQGQNLQTLSKIVQQLTSLSHALFSQWFELICPYQIVWLQKVLICKWPVYSAQNHDILNNFHSGLFIYRFISSTCYIGVEVGGGRYRVCVNTHQNKEYWLHVEQTALCNGDTASFLRKTMFILPIVHCINLINVTVMLQIIT